MRVRDIKRCPQTYKRRYREAKGDKFAMKQKTMQELNEQYKDCPQRENEYTVCGQKMIVVSHFIGDKDLDDELYRLAFDRALNEVLNKPIRSCESV